MAMQANIYYSPRLKRCRPPAAIFNQRFVAIARASKNKTSSNLINTARIFDIVYIKSGNYQAVNACFQKLLQLD